MKIYIKSNIVLLMMNVNLNNLRKKCRFKEKYTGSGFNPYAPKPKYPEFCHPSEISVIKSNVKLFNF